MFLHVADSLFAAVPLRYRRLAASAARRGDTFTIVTPQSFPSLRRINPIYFVLLLPFLAAIRLWRGRDRAEVAIFHSYAGWVFSLFKGRVRIITSFHGFEPLYFLQLRNLARAQGHDLTLRYRIVYGWLVPRLCKLAVRRSDLVLCQTVEEVNYLIDQGWATLDHVSRLEAGVPSMFFSEHRAYPPRARRLLMVSQWREAKGVLYAVEAFATLVRGGADVEMWCAGTRQTDEVVLGAFPEDVRDRVRNYANVPHSTMADIYRQCDIFLHPSMSEGSSHAQLEAMASGLPMIATATAPAVDLLVDGAGFLRIPKRDAASIVRAVTTLLDDVTLRTRLGQTAQRAARNVTAESADAKFLALLDGLVPAKA